MMLSSKLYSKKNVQLCIKVLVLASIVGLYFIVLLRESFAAWETTKAKNANVLNVSKNLARSSFKRHERKYRIITTRSPPPRNQIRPPTTLNPIYEYSEEINIAAEHDFSERRTHLEESCQNNHFNGRYPPNAWEFFISPGHGIAWCNVFKAASSTWMYYFNILGGYDIKFLQRTNTSPLELARKRFPRPTQAELQEALSTSLSFLIVREPFERLLSAYRNKLEGCRNKYYKLLGAQIVKNYRRTAHKRKPPGPTFKEFVLFLIENYKNKINFDEHWAPIYTFCTPCSINYTIIAKVETFQRDSEYIIRQTGLETLLLNLRKAPPKRMRSISNQSASQTAKLIKKYFSQIDKKLLDKLLIIYGPDFDLFDYDSTKYYGIVQTPPKRVASSTTMHHGTTKQPPQTQPPMNKSV